MNTVMINDGGVISVTNDDSILTSVVSSLSKNNTFCPNYSRVIYNLSEIMDKDEDGNKTPTGEYTLATTVFFKDGTKVTTRNVLKDKIEVETQKIKLSDGTETEVKVASESSREIGFVYALVKRLVCKSDENGTILNSGFISFLKKAVDSAWNQNLEEVRNKKEKEISRSLHKQKQEEAAQKKEDKEKPSLRKCVNSLTELLSRLEEKLSK